MLAAGKRSGMGPAGLPVPSLGRGGQQVCSGFTAVGGRQVGWGRQGSQETSLWPLCGYCLRK